MRAGTQTLIQALQALPWTDVENDDDIMNMTASPSDSSDDEDQPGRLKNDHFLGCNFHISGFFFQVASLPPFTQSIGPWHVHVD
jgi:hypothetical protein